MKRCRILIIIAAVLCCQFAYATIIHIPGDYPTIQQGINASANGDTVLVQPGEYIENIDFGGKNIAVGSRFLTTGDTTYISSTIIDGDSAGSVVTFENGEDSTAVIVGFTIRDGHAILGGGILCDSSHPKIANNYIANNSTYGQYPLNLGGGIYCFNSNSYITGNTISENAACYGGGIYCDSSNSIICNNIIMQNFATY
jgi:hypothetical protein